MKHHTNVGETSEAKTLVRRIDESVQRIDESVHHELPPSAKDCFIYKVHEGLRKVKPKAYEPVLVSIGPYHIQNPRLQAMKQHKLRYLHSLLKRTQEGIPSVNKYVLALQELEDRARECYVEPIDHLNSSDDFVEMMLLDGCFIIEYFHKILDFDEDDLILKVNGMSREICLDLILLENQLPYFVLSQLYEMTIKAENRFHYIPLLSQFYEMSKKSFPETLEVLSISDMAMLAFAFVLPKPRDNFLKAVGNNDTKDAKHLLHLLHMLCAPSSSETSDDNNEVIDQNPPLFHLIHILCAPSSKERTAEVIDQNRPLLDQNRSSSEKRTPKNDHKEEILLQMRSVVELEEAGVKFKMTGKTDCVSLFDIQFYNGLMEIPRFIVEDSTDTLFRNLIAYEQHSPDVELKYFTDFAVFMDRLITTEKDVNLLRLEGILVNLLGDDKVVTELFNRLGDGVIISSNFCYSEECIKVNKHCKKSWNKMTAKLRGDYFNYPWASVSTFAAGLLLLLTIVQTIVALLALFT